MISTISSNTLSVANTVCLAPNLSGLQHLAIEETLEAVDCKLLNAITIPKSNIALRIAFISTGLVSLVDLASLLPSTGELVAVSTLICIGSPFTRLTILATSSGRLLFIEIPDLALSDSDHTCSNTSP